MLLSAAALYVELYLLSGCKDMHMLQEDKDLRFKMLSTIFFRCVSPHLPHVVFQNLPSSDAPSDFAFVLDSVFEVFCLFDMITLVLLLPTFDL